MCWYSSCSSIPAKLIKDTCLIPQVLCFNLFVGLKLGYNELRSRKHRIAHSFQLYFCRTSFNICFLPSAELDSSSGMNPIHFMTLMASRTNSPKKCSVYFQRKYTNSISEVSLESLLLIMTVSLFLTHLGLCLLLKFSNLGINIQMVKSIWKKRMMSTKIILEGESDMIW